MVDALSGCRDASGGHSPARDGDMVCLLNHFLTKTLQQCPQFPSMQFTTKFTM